MTTYILHGGRTRIENENNRHFYKLMADYLPENGTWLACLFAREEEEWPPMFKRDSGWMKDHSGDKNISCILANEEDFPEQFAKADVAYFCGGETEKLMQTMRQWPQAKAWLQSPDKVIAGSSAGSYMLGTNFMSQFGGLGEGFGIIPYGMVAHHREAEFMDQQDFSQRKRPLLMLHETQFCVIEA